MKWTAELRYRGTANEYATLLMPDGKTYTLFYPERFNGYHLEVAQAAAEEANKHLPKLWTWELQFEGTSDEYAAVRQPDGRLVQAINRRRTDGKHKILAQQFVDTMNAK